MDSHQAQRRIEELAQELKSALGHEFTEVAGRGAIRIRLPDGASRIAFVTDSERDALERYLREGAPKMHVAGVGLMTLHDGDWVGAAPNGCSVRAIDFGDQGEDTAGRISTAANSVFARVPAAKAHAAETLAPNAKVWNEGRSVSRKELLAALELAAITLHPPFSVIWFDAGDLFAGHRVQVRVDRDGELGEAHV